MPNQPTNPLISVIMPAYNVEPFIGEAIRSIQNQTHQNWELLVINDASTDKTAQIAKEFAKHDKRIKVFSNKNNSKDWFCRNFGLKRAKGQYIAWQDADDTAAAKRLEKQLHYLQKNSAVDLVGCYWQYFSDGSDQTLEKNSQRLAKTYDKIFFNNLNVNQQLNAHGLGFHLHGPTCCFKTSMLQKIGSVRFLPFPFGSDTDFIYRLLEHDIQIRNLPEKLYHYRQHANQTTNTQKNLQTHIALLLNYNHIARCEQNRDPCQELFLKGETLNQKTLSKFYQTFFNIPNLSYHQIFLKDLLRTHQFFWQHIWLDYQIIMLACWHQPRLWRLLPIIIMKSIYCYLPLLHRPWHWFKKTFAVKSINWGKLMPVGKPFAFFDKAGYSNNKLQKNHFRKNFKNKKL